MLLIDFEAGSDLFLTVVLCILVALAAWFNGRAWGQGFLTMHADDATMNRAPTAGAFGYVLKPNAASEVKAVIEVALNRHQSE